MDFEEIRSQVLEAGGLKCFRMQVLREASPYKKLGPGVIEEIQEELDRRGLRYGVMGRYQEDAVYVYDPNSDAGQLLAAITDDVSEAGANAILQAVAPDAEAKTASARLEEIRVLLVQMDDVFKRDATTTP
jgi:hypothetical protein